jgi:hypothetical protein
MIKDYKNIYFEKDQPLTYLDLNSMSRNDQLIYDYLEPQGRGVIDFKESVSNSTTRNIFAPGTVSNSILLDNYRPVEFFVGGQWQAAKLSCTIAATRATRLTFFLPMFILSSLQSGGAFRLGFFYKYNNSDIQLLNANLKNTSFITHDFIIRQKSLTMQYTDILDAGVYEFFIGVKVYRCTVRFSDDQNYEKRPMQFYAEDLGFPFRSEREDFEQ